MADEHLHPDSNMAPSSAYAPPPFPVEFSEPHTGNLPVPPNNEFAERAILGAIILDDEQIEKVVTNLSAKDFYAPKHRMIYETIFSLFEEHESIDLVTIQNKMKQRNEFDAIGGLAFLARLADESPVSANLESYVKIVKDCSLLRALLESSRDIQKSVFSRVDESAEDLLFRAQQLLIKLSERYERGIGLNPIGEAAGAAFNRIEELFSNPSPNFITGVPSGFTGLDRITAGFQGSDLIVIAGRPSMGKTALAMNIAEHAAIIGQKTVAVFSLEMSPIQLGMRCLSSISGVPFNRIQKGDLGTGRDEEHNWDRIASAWNLLETLPIFVDSTPGISPLDIVAKTRRLHREKGVDLVIVDYLQLLQMKEADSNRVNEIANITRSLKVLAQELNIPVIVLSQLSRAPEQRTNKVPILADLRDSGAIEQDADLIIFIYRDEYYNEQSEDQNLADLFISKHRNGETGKVKLMFMKECTRFQNYSDATISDAI